jgi:hypothetical protein
MADPAFVQLKVTHFTVRASGDAARPITIGFMYEGRGKDNAREGFEADVTREEARRMANMILRSVRS